VRNKVLIVELGFNAPTHAADSPDSLYVGDATDNTVKAFDADTGTFQGEFVKKGNSPIKGPMGLIFNSEGDLLVSNQNADTNKSGEILKHDGATGKFLGALIPHNDLNAPFAPRGIVLANDVLFVAGLTVKGKDGPPGRLLAYTKDGAFLADLTPDHNKFPGAFSTDEFHARGVVIGPDGYLYVSVCDDLDPKSADFNQLPGWILRFDSKGVFDRVVASYETCADLHRPEGLTFGPEPDRKLYVTAFRKDPDDTDKILIFEIDVNGKGTCVDKIDLYQVGKEPRASAQALLFGPGGFLFVPISGSGPDPKDTGDTGAVRRYDLRDKSFTNFVPPAAKGGPLGAGWYLTFGKTDPSTLAYPVPEHVGGNVLPPTEKPNGYSLSDIAKATAFFATRGPGDPNVPNDPNGRRESNEPNVPFQILYDSIINVPHNTFSVRPDTMLYVPIFFVSDSPPPTGNFPDDVGDPKAIAKYMFKKKELGAQSLMIEVDGKITSIKEDPGYFVGVTTELFDGGTHYITAAVFLTPLTKGTHTLRSGQNSRATPLVVCLSLKFHTR
jgi:hypothetical protein